MADNIRCPHCGGTVLLPDEFQRRNVRCPKCQAVFVAPAATDITATPPQSGAPGGSASILAGLPESAESRPLRPRRLGDAAAEDPDALADAIVSRGNFRPGGGLALSVKVLLALDMLLSIVVLGSDYLQYNLATRLVAGEDVPLAELDSNDARQMMLGIVHFVIFLITAILFVMWFYRAYANLRPLGAQTLTCTPGWAAGCWFVPIMNLIRPVQIAQEIWRNSDPSAPPTHDVPVRPAGSALIGFWWAAWLVANVLSQISLRIGRAANTPETLRSATGLAMIAEVASLLAGALALAVVISVDARQNARAEALQANAAEDQGRAE
jgi:phage FluMu protein Com